MTPYKNKTIPSQGVRELLGFEKSILWVNLKENYLTSNKIKIGNSTFNCELL